MIYFIDIEKVASLLALQPVITMRNILNVSSGLILENKGMHAV